MARAIKVIVYLATCLLLCGRSHGLNITPLKKSVAKSFRGYKQHFIAMTSSDQQSRSTAIASARIPESVDYKAIASYLSATSIQFAFIIGFLHVFDKILSTARTLPRQLDIVIFAPVMFLISLKSRIFSPLDNSRPKADKSDPVFLERKRPSWQPPPIAFPVIWMTIGFLRTASSLVVYQTTGTVVAKPFLAMMAHLSIADTWNTINNVEKRMGPAVLGVLLVLASAIYTTYLYYLTMPFAGRLLAPSCVWLTVASFLIFSIWRLNSELLFRKPLLPMVDDNVPSAWRWSLPFFKKTGSLA